LDGNCLLTHVVEGIVEGMRRRGRRKKEEEEEVICYWMN